MGLQDTFKNVAKAAANALGDVVEVVTYRKITATAYAPATSATPTETATIIADIDAVWSDIRSQRVDGQGVNIRQRQVVLFGKDLGTTIPTEDGEIHRVSGDLFDHTGAGTADDFSFEADPYNAIRGASLGSIAVGQWIHTAFAAESGNTGIAKVTGINTDLIVVDKSLTAEDSSVARIRDVEIWRIIGPVVADPAGATYTCLVRQ